MTNPHILYIEDERQSIQLVSKALQSQGYRVTWTTSGLEGLQMMKTHKPALLLLDLGMPDISGPEIYRHMKEHHHLKDIPVIVVTATVPERGKVIIDGCPPVDDYITKPFKLSRLFQAVKTVIRP